MKKLILLTISLIFIVTICITIFPKKGNKIRVAEVTHSAFYAPFYVAIENGYFEKRNIDISLLLTPGADKVTAAVMSGDVEIGLCGSEATVYIYNGGEKDYLVNFSGLTSKDGSFLVSRKKIDDFKINDVKNKYIIGGRSGGMPELTLEYALKKNNIDPKMDLSIDTSIAFASMQGAFIGGTGDFVTLFEPNALNLEKQGLGYVVASIGELAGNVPYTVFNTKKSFLNENKDLIKNFEDAIQEGLNFIYENDNLEIAKTITNQFPDSSVNDLEKVIKRYKSIKAWPKNTFISRTDFNRVLNIMETEENINLYNNLFD